MPMPFDNGTSGDSSDSSMEVLSAVGIDLTNMTEASEYLKNVLDDSVLQFDGIKYSKFFWYGIVAAISLAAAINIYQRVISFTRMRAAAKKKHHPAKPSNPLTLAVATLVSVVRAVTYFQASPGRYPALLRVPPLGVLVMLLAYLSFVLTLQFVHVSIPGDAHWEAIGIRAGWLSIGQIPLLILLAGKYNIIGFLTGVGYERLNVIHRWVARVLLLTATLHFGYQSYGWNRLGLWQLEFDTDTCAPTGMAAYVLLIWMNLSTIAPFRNLFYEFFLIQHLLTFLGFIIAIMYHLPLETAPSVRTYIWISIGFYIADRLVRGFSYTFNNISPGRATLTEMPNGVTKISIANSHIRNWSPGAFVLISIPRLGFGQSHPATIASTPTSSGGGLVFFLRARGGFTQRLTAQAKSDMTARAASPFNYGKGEIQGEIQGEPRKRAEPTYLALIDGPYSGIGANFGAFDTTVLIAASTGVTFTLPILLELAHRISNRPLPLRRVAFIYIVKDSSSTDCVFSEICSAIDALCNAGVEATAQIFITSEQLAIYPSSDAKTCNCRDSPIGQDDCCCSSSRTPFGDEGMKFEHCARTASEAAIAREKQKAAIPRNIPSPTSSPSSSKAVSLHAGRPNVIAILSGALSIAEGEMGVAVCGPLELSQRVRRDVASLTVKTLGGSGIFLHAENFGI